VVGGGKGNSGVEDVLLTLCLLVSPFSLSLWSESGGVGGRSADTLRKWTDSSCVGATEDML
jgi:hypothetical protein